MTKVWLLAGAALLGATPAMAEDAPPQTAPAQQLTLERVFGNPGLNGAAIVAGRNAADLTQAARQ